MKLFSERYGYKNPKEIFQIKSLDDNVRVKLWNLTYELIWEQLFGNLISDTTMKKQMNDRYFKTDVEVFLNMPIDHLKQIMRNIFKTEIWYEVFDFLEVLAGLSSVPEHLINEFVMDCNEALESEVSGYRFIDKLIVPITDEHEITTIEESVSEDNPIDNAKIHIHEALQKLANRDKPDYRNSIKESISAVESLCKAITKDKNATLGDALKVIRKTGLVKMHPSFVQGIEKIYGYTSDDGGIRHCLMDEDSLDLEDARFMLVLCTAFVNYLIIKSDKAEMGLN